MQRSAFESFHPWVIFGYFGSSTCCDNVYNASCNDRDVLCDLLSIFSFFVWARRVEKKCNDRTGCGSVYYGNPAVIST